MYRPLRDLCHLQTGFSFRGSVQDEVGGRYPVVQLGDVDWEARTIPLEALPRVAGFGPEAPHLLRAGDVLFASRGRALQALVYTADAPAIAAATFFVLRVRAGLLPEYLAWYLNAAPAQAHFAACSRGTNMRVVPRSCLAALPVPVPAPEVQQRIARADRLAFEEGRLSAHLHRRRRLLVERALLQSVEPA